jgi:hypothetical protein
VLLCSGCLFEIQMLSLRRRSKKAKQVREDKLKKQLSLRKHHQRLQQIAKRLADDAKKYIKLAEDGTKAGNAQAAISRSPKGADAAKHRGFDAFTGVIPGGLGAADSLYRPGGDRGMPGLGKVDEYGDVERFGYDEYYDQEEPGSKTPARVAATRAAAAASAAQAVALAAAKLVQLAEQQLRDAEQENDSEDEDFIREMEEGMVEADGIDPLFFDDDDDDNYDTITIGETGFQYKVRAGGLDGALDLGDEELDKLYSESWRAAMQVELGGGGGANKRNAVLGGGNFGGGGGGTQIQLPSMGERARKPVSMVGLYSCCIQSTPSLKAPGDPTS